MEEERKTVKGERTESEKRDEREKGKTVRVEGRGGTRETEREETRDSGRRRGRDRE